MDSDGIDTGLLPPQLRAIVKAIGVAETLVLLEARGGVRLWVPESDNRSVVLRELLQPESVAALVDRFGGQRLELPMKSTLLVQWRNHQIVADSRTMSYTDLARKYGITRRWAIKMVREWATEVDDDQFDLFG